MIRRMTGLVLACAILLGVCMLSAWAAAGPVDDGAAQYPIEIAYNAEQFIGLFQDGQTPFSDTTGLEPEASYAYQIYTNEDDERCVDLTLTLSCGGVSHTLYATGTIVSYRMPDNRMMQSGPLEGTLTVNGIDYLFMIGFHQYEDEDRAHFTANITQLSGEGDIMMIEFGEDIISQETREKLPGFFRVDEDAGDAVLKSAAASAVIAVWVVNLQKIFQKIG